MALVLKDVDLDKPRAQSSTADTDVYESAGDSTDQPRRLVRLRPTAVVTLAAGTRGTAARAAAAAGATFSGYRHRLVYHTSRDSHLSLVLTASSSSAAAFDELGEALDAVLGSYRLGS
ncbi:hypothetical protein MRX96_042314 [Rhipicephalus microplus]